MSNKTGFFLSAPRNVGFAMAFANGWKVSVQWGPGNYGTNRNETDRAACVEARTAEVLVFNEIGKDERESGWQSAEQVAAILAEVAARPPLLDQRNAG